MTQNTLISASMVGYLAFFASLAVILAALFWYLHRKEMNAREQFFRNFDASDLRMSRYQIGLVYRVMGGDDQSVSVVPIWRGKSPIVGAEEQTLDASHLMPFDATRFS